MCTATLCFAELFATRDQRWGIYFVLAPPNVCGAGHVVFGGWLGLLLGLLLYLAARAARAREAGGGGSLAKVGPPSSSSTALEATVHSERPALEGFEQEVCAGARRLMEFAQGRGADCNDTLRHGINT